MSNSIVNPPQAGRPRPRSNNFEGIRVVGGVTPTSGFPAAVGSGIFGLEGQDNGVFGGPQVPASGTGIFYNDYAKDSWEVQQPDLEWVMVRRPGRPLYPGSSARGIVLEGPSMGNDAGAQNNVLGTAGKVLLGAATAALVVFVHGKYKQSRGEG